MVELPRRHLVTTVPPLGQGALVKGSLTHVLTQVVPAATWGQRKLMSTAFAATGRSADSTANVGERACLDESRRRQARNRRVSRLFVEIAEDQDRVPRFVAGKKVRRLVGSQLRVLVHGGP